MEDLIPRKPVTLRLARRELLQVDQEAARLRISRHDLLSRWIQPHLVKLTAAQRTP